MKTIAIGIGENNNIVKEKLQLNLKIYMTNRRKSDIIYIMRRRLNFIFE